MIIGLVLVTEYLHIGYFFHHLHSYVSWEEEVVKTSTAQRNHNWGLQWTLPPTSLLGKAVLLCCKRKNQSPTRQGHAGLKLVMVIQAHSSVRVIADLVTKHHNRKQQLQQSTTCWAVCFLMKFSAGSGAARHFSLVTEVQSVGEEAARLLVEFPLSSPQFHQRSWRIFQSMVSMFPSVIYVLCTVLQDMNWKSWPSCGHTLAQK